MHSRLHSLLNQPEVVAVQDIARTRNTPVLLVGGSVRDALMGNDAPRDLDFSVQGDAVALGRAVANALKGDFYVMDAERGTARVLVSNDEARTASKEFTARYPTLTLDFAVCRGESWRDDLFARDFTINAIAVDLKTGDLLDSTGGLADVQARIIRATTDKSLADDPVRALRAIRLAHQFDMRIEPATLKHVKAVGADIVRPSAERVRDELFEIMNLSKAAPAIRRLDEVGLLAHIALEIEPMRTCEQSPPHNYTVLEHTWRVMEALDKEISDSTRRSELGNLQSEMTEGRTRASLFRFATLLHDCAKPDTRSVGEDGRIHFYGHEEIGAAKAAARARALRLSGDEVSMVRTFVRNHMRPNQMARDAARNSRPPTPRTLYRFFRDTGDCAPLLALFAIADCIGKRGESTQPDDCAPSKQIASLLIERYYTQFDKSVAPAPLITGKDVLDLGVPQGARIGEILEAIREAQMTGEIASRAQAMQMVERMVNDE
jgi:tRNA nucleotidyltransferase/poly(A) polymerase